ncbi:nuclear transport factor 2 family protein [Actinomadura sp. 6N118]|uniref:nuclear transport factor 2 family protein n=1 Tax=Actinomadura sp. 6N118 TaxID=3375151 RepID=UPI0037A2F5D0
MSDSPSVAVVRRLYDSKGDPAVSQEIMAPDIVWDITPGFPNGGVYHGFDSVVNDFFGPLFGRFDTFYPVAEEFYADGDHVIALGDYQGSTKTGKNVQVRFIHLWTVREGKLARMQQAADSLVVDRALNG